MKIVVVIPTYNERKNVAALIPKLADALKRGRISGRIIVVDDGSEDGTVDTVRRLARKYPVMLIERPRKAGIGSAYKDGIKHALSMRPSVVVQMDADFSHPPEDVPRLVA